MSQISVNPFKGYRFVTGSPWKLAEYLRIMGCPIDVERRFIPSSGVGSRNKTAPCIYLGKTPSVRELMGREFGKYEKLAASEENYFQLGEVVAERKARWVYEVVKAPLLVEAIHLFIPRLSGFPGLATEDFENVAEFTTLERMFSGDIQGASRGADQSAFAIATIGALVGIHQGRLIGFQVRHGVVRGRIKIVRGESKNGFGWDYLFVPDGSPDGKTFRELGALKSMYSMRYAVVEEIRKNPFWLPNEFSWVNELSN